MKELYAFNFLFDNAELPSKKTYQFTVPSRVFISLYLFYH